MRLTLDNGLKLAVEQPSNKEKKKELYSNLWNNVSNFYFHARNHFFIFYNECNFYFYVLTNSWFFFLTWTVSITHIVLMPSSLWTANNDVLVYYVWYTSFSVCYIFKFLRAANNSFFVSFWFCVLQVCSDSYFLINLSILLHLMESFWH